MESAFFLISDRNLVIFFQNSAILLYVVKHKMKQQPVLVVHFYLNLLAHLRVKFSVKTVIPKLIGMTVDISIDL